MQLKEFSLISPVIESSHVFKAIETAIPIDVIEQTIGSTEVREERKRKLPYLMFTAAQQAGISPLRLGFTGTLKVLRRAIADFQDIQPEELPFFSRG